MNKELLKQVLLELIELDESATNDPKLHRQRVSDMIVLGSNLLDQIEEKN